MTAGLRPVLLALFATLALAGSARAQAPVPLGSANAFAILAGTGVTNTGPTVVTGDLGVSPGSSVIGFPPGVVNGTIHRADSAAAQAQLDLASAYNNASGQSVTSTIPTELGGTTLPPGVYESDSGAFVITGTLTLDGQGDGDAIFIFRTASTLSTAGGNSQINLIGSAQSCNVSWRVGSSAAIGASTVFRGNVLALSTVTAAAGATVDGRLLARNDAVALDTNAVTAAQCDDEKPAVKITRVPKRCTTQNFKARVNVSEPLRVTTTVLLDGRQVKRSTKRSFTVLIEAKALAPGRHTIRAVSRDAADNERTKKARFDTCVRGISFTG
jgi:Ice-binding-like